MKKFFSFLMVLVAIPLFAESIPDGYYDAIEGLQDSVLKSTLSTICHGGERYDYGPNSYHSTNDKDGAWKKGDLKAYGTWQALPITDILEDGSIWDMYSNSVRYYPNKRGESGCSLNIEHCLPKSWWGGDVNDAYKDLYHLNPSDAQANSQKSNYPPGHVQAGDKFDNGSFRMDKTGSSLYGYMCFEPAAEYRGDFARAYFYIATAYEYLTWSDTYINLGYINPDRSQFFSDAILGVLLDWHRADPVSEKEICRADKISSIQHNRNPFIDYPELVEYIWGNKKGQSVVLANLTCTEGSATCVDYEPIPVPCICYDTLLNFPALTKAIVNAQEHCFASDKIQSNGTSSITMGASSTDGYLTFSNLNLQDTAVLRFRASIYNTATSMQIDIYAGNTLIKTITDKAVQYTRNEVVYNVTIPAGTDSVTVMSVGGSTSKRSCMQELYLLRPLPQDDPTSIENTAATPNNSEPVKQIRNNQLLIIRDGKTYNALGQRL